MEEVTTIGLDIAKSVFQVHGVCAGGEVVILPTNAFLRGLGTVLSMCATAFLLLLSAIRDSFRGRAALQLELIALLHRHRHLCW